MKYLAACVLLLASSVSLAGVWTTKQPLTSLYVLSTYDGVFVTQATMSTDPSIMVCNRDMYFLPHSHPFFKEIYAMLLAARASGRSIELYLDVCTTGVGGVRPLVSFVRDGD